MRFQRYAPGLAKRGVQMSVFTQAIDGKLVTRDGILGTTEDAKESPLFEVLDNIPIQRVRLPRGWRRKPIYFSRLVDYCEEQPGKIGIVHFLSLSNWAYPWVRRLRRLGIRTVLTQTMVSTLSANPWKRSLQRFDRRSRFNLVDQVVVSSDVMRRSIELLGVSSRIHVIPNGVNLELFRPVENADSRARLRHKLGLAPEWQVVLAVGPINPRKGTDILIEACAFLYKEFPNLRLLLVGPRHDLGRKSYASFHHQIERIIEHTNAWDRVIFTGAVENVQEYLQAADVLALPSRREGFLNVVLEGMASGIPVITSPFIGLPREFGIPGVHFILSTHDPKGLSADIRRLLTDSAQRQRIVQEAQRWSEQRHDVNLSLDQYAALYRGLASGQD